MGITDYGLTSSLGSYNYKSTFVESLWDSGTTFGIGTANGGGCLDPDAESLICFTIQQNDITQQMYVPGNHGYYWTQNVPEVAYDSSCSSPCVSGTYSVTFLDNIWNFSDSKGICPSGEDTGAGCINPSTIVGNGKGGCAGGTGGAPEFYYCVSNTIYDVTLPFTITAATNLNYFGCASGENCLYFYGSVEVGPTVVYGAYYDEVAFHFTDGSYPPYYQVKNAHAPIGLPLDDEWVFGGPADGSGNTILNYGDLQSFYCDSVCATESNWHSIRNAWSSGYDTAEYAYDMYVIPQFNFRDVAELYISSDDSQTYVF